jgi:MoaA/NifB/PqqE/SkfB family radical SAM enzyme
MYRARARSETFGAILSFPDGWIDLFNGAALPRFGEDVTITDLERYRLGDGAKILAAKKAGILPAELYNLPSNVLGSLCPLKAPVVVQIEITRECNLACQHCFNYSGLARENEMTFKEIATLLMELKELEVMSVFFGGGEPTLRPDLPALAKFCDEIDLDFFILSNGSGITPRLLERMPSRTYFVLSFDGVESHDKLRLAKGPSEGRPEMQGMGFNALQQRFRWLREAGFAFTAQYVLQKKNVTDLIQTYEWCAAEKIDFAAIDLFVTGRAKENDGILLGEQELEKIGLLANAKFAYEKIQAEWDILQGKDRGRVITNPFHFMFIARLEEIFARSLSGSFYAYITSDGNVFPDNWHGGEGMFPAGSIREKNFGRIWREGFDEIRRLSQWRYWKRCRTCPVSQWFCDCRLPVLSRNLYGVDTLCGATEKQKEMMLVRHRLRDQLDVLSADRARAVDVW